VRERKSLSNKQSNTYRGVMNRCTFHKKLAIILGRLSHKELQKLRFYQKGWLYSTFRDTE